MHSSRVLEAIAVTAELCGRTFSPAAAMVFAQDIEGFEESAVLAALTRCRKEVRGILTVQDVVSRIDDGRPGVEEAWAMVPYDDSQSVVWTQEIAAAWGVAGPLLQAGDQVGARMAFKEKYLKEVNAARDRCDPPRWSPSFGSDKAARQGAVLEAVRNKRIPLAYATELLPPEEAEGLVLSLGITKHPLLAAPNEHGKAKIKEMMLMLKAPKSDE